MNEAIQGIDGREIAWKPLPKQFLALRSPVDQLLYGGEKGGGKSEFLNACWGKLLRLAQRKFEATGQAQHKCRIIIFRRNLDDLKDLIAKSHYFFPIFDPRARWSENGKTWTFGSSATVAYRHLDGPNDYLAYNGQELPGIGFDQIEQIKHHEFTFIVANCRSGDPDYHAAKMVRATANPGGESWILNHFGIPKDCNASGEIVRTPIKLRDGSTHTPTRVFIRAHLRENNHLPPSYEGDLRAGYNADQAAMYLEGDFYRVAGTFFSLLLQPRIHFQRSRPLSASFEWRHATDWGSTNPACTFIGARDHDGRLYVVDEHYKPGISGSKYGEYLGEFWERQKWCSDRKFERGDFYGVIDKQARDKHNGDATAAQGISDAGFSIYDAKKERLGGCNQMKERLLLDRMGEPQVIIFEDRCPNLTQALSAIPSLAPVDPDDYNPASEYAHAVDAFRFLCMEFPTQPQVVVDPRDAAMRKWKTIIDKARDRQNSGQERYS